MNSSSDVVRQPIIEHVKEFRRRLIIALLAVGIGAAVGYALRDTLAALIQKPLGEKLYFTSPTGGFNFVFVICLSFGIMVALPVIIYQILAFLRPALPHSGRSIRFWYPLCSVVLAAIGVGFAYFISLPAALHFLTTIGDGINVESLITTDAYFRFALAYLIGYAVLFQLPLILLIINRATPLKPSKLMKGQRYVIVGSFIIAAILTPTPDPLNQSLMAGPIILLFQLSVILIWMRNMRRRPAKASFAIKQPTPAVARPVPAQPVVAAAVTPKPAMASTRKVMDFAPARPTPVVRRPVDKAPTPLRRQVMDFAPVSRPRPVLDITRPISS